MIRVEFTIAIEVRDSLLAARNFLFQAMFERAAGLLQLDVLSDTSDGEAILWIDELNLETTSSFLDLLVPLDLLKFVVVEVTSQAEMDGLEAFRSTVAMDCVEADGSLGAER